MWRNGRRKGLKIPRGGPVPVRVRSQAPLTEVSPFWRKYMRPLLCLIFFRSFGSLPPPCCDRTVRNSDAHALCRRRDKASPVGVRYSVATLRFAPYGPVTSTTNGSLAILAKRNILSESRALSSPIGNRYSGRSRDLSHLRQVVPYRRSLFRRSAMNCLSPYAHFAPYGCRLRQLSRSCCKCPIEEANFEAKPRTLAPPTEVSPFWRKYMRPLLCLIFFSLFWLAFH